MFPKQWISTFSVLVSFLVCFCIASPAHAAGSTYYVSPSGSDSNPGTLSAPFRTVQRGVNALSGPGDTLYIRAGTYDEEFSIGPASMVGTASQPLTISGYQNERPLIKPSSRWTGHIVTFNAAGSEADGNIKLMNMDLDGGNVDTQGTHCIDLAMNGVTIENILCRDNAYDGINNGARRSVIRNNTILNVGRLQPTCNDQKGVGIYVGYDHSLIENNVIDGSRTGGIILQYSGPTDNIVRNNILRNFGTKSPHYPNNTPSCIMGRVTGTGMNIGPGAQRNQIYNNVIAHVRGEQQDADAFFWWADDAIENSVWHNTIVDVDVALWNGADASDAEVRNNIFANVGTLTFGDVTNFTLTNNLVNPSLTATFVNAAADDFHLTSGSPAIDAGVTISTVTDDFKGTPRPQGGAHDIGADEFGGGETPTPTVSLTATPASVQPGSPITVTWSVTASQNSAYDWVGLFKTGDPNTSYDESRWLYTNGNTTGSVSWNAPSTPGTYEARYLLDNGYTDVASSSPVTVSSATASFSITVTPASVRRGGLITVTWTAPQGQTSPYDWIGLFKTTDPNESFDPSRWIYTNGAPTGSTTFTAPVTLGTYDARYLLNDGYVDAARSGPVTVKRQ